MEYQQRSTRWKLTLFFALLFGQQLCAQDSNEQCTICGSFPPRHFDRWWADLNVSAYYPFSNHLSNTNHSAIWANYSLDLSYNFCINWQPWIGVEYTTNHGKSTFSNKSRISMIPITWGLKYRFLVTNSVDIYFGIGGTYSFLIAKNDSPFVPKRPHRGGFGGVIKWGSVYHFTSHFYAKLFCDYLYQRFHFSTINLGGDRFVMRRDLDMSGVKLGVGCGLIF